MHQMTCDIELIRNELYELLKLCAGELKSFPKECE